MSDLNAELKILTDKLISEGKLIEAGFLGVQLMYPPETPKEQLAQMRIVFFLGAQHSLTSALSVLDPGTEPTEKDFLRLTQIMTEIEEFSKAFEASLSSIKQGKTNGS